MGHKYFILLDEAERNELESMADNLDLSGQRRRRASILLLADIGPHGNGLSASKISEQTGATPRFVTHVLKRAMKNGPVKCAYGADRQGQGRGAPQRKKLSPESESEITICFNNNEKSKAELARRFGVSPSTISRIIDRNELERQEITDGPFQFCGQQFVGFLNGHSERMGCQSNKRRAPDDSTS